VGMVLVLLSSWRTPTLRHPGESRDPVPLLRSCCSSRNPSHVPVLFRTPSMARESLLFACPKRSNQEKGHPRYRGRRASCPATARARCGGSLTGHPWPDSELAGILPATLRAFSFAHSPRHRGPREEQSAAVPAAEERAAPRTRCPHPGPLPQAGEGDGVPSPVCGRRCRRRMRALLILGPVWGGEGRPKRPEGSARGIAPIPLQAMDGLSAEPGRP